MDRDRACLDDSLRYYIYGAGTFGAIIGDFLIREGFQIESYIDKRAMELDGRNGIPIIEPGHLEGGGMDGICVVIAIKDVFEHEKIKDFLLDKGINKIIYRPQNVLDGGGSDIEKEINSLYDAIAEFSLKKNAELPLLGFGQPGRMEREWVLEEAGDWLTSYAPCELVYTNFTDSQRDTWGNVCILGLVPHLELFRFFAGDRQSSEAAYLEFCVQNAILQGIEPTDSWKRNVLRNRGNVFHQMFYYWSVDRGFFIRNAPTAVWNQKGFFNLTSGKHRAAFLAAMGQRWIPLRISRQDYLEWKNEPAYGKYREQLIGKAISPKLPVEHPLLMDQRNEAYRFWNDILAVVEFYICKWSLGDNGMPNYRGQSFYSHCGSEGYIERNIRKFGLDVFCAGKPGLPEQEGNKLLCAGNLELSAPAGKEYDFGLVDYREGGYRDIGQSLRREFAILEGDGAAAGQNGRLLYRNYYGGCLVSIVMRGKEDI